jgi:ADP-heptose:LPS heptosyltransferase
VHLVTLSRWVNFSYIKTAGIHTFTAQPRTPYVFSFSQYEALTKTEDLRKLVVLQSLFWPRLPPFIVRPTGGRGETVLFFTGSGGYGDQVMAWPAAKLLADMGYLVHVLCDPGNDHLWSWFPWVQTVRLLPLPVREIESFNHLALFPYVTNLDEHSGQPHPTDHLMRQMGVDPQTVPPERKVVRPPLSLGQLSELGGTIRPFNVIQLAGSSNLRRTSPGRLKIVLQQLVNQIPVSWVAFHDQDDLHTKAAREVAVENPNLQVRVNVPFDQLVGLTAGADLTIGPDSFISHLRGALSLPGIAVFGTHEPALRTRYYPAITPIWEKLACPNSPCLVYRNEFPKYLCPPTVEPRTECEVLAAGYDRLVEVALRLSKR